MFSALALLLDGIDLFLSGCWYGLASGALAYCDPPESVYYCDPMWCP